MEDINFSNIRRAECRIYRKQQLLLQRTGGIFYSRPKEENQMVFLIEDQEVLSVFDKVVFSVENLISFFSNSPNGVFSKRSEGLLSRKYKMSTTIKSCQ